jgi:hypothetical protein
MDKKILYDNPGISIKVHLTTDNIKTKCGKTINSYYCFDDIEDMLIEDKCKSCFIKCKSC